MGKRRGGYQCTVQYPDSMVNLILLANATKDANRFRNGRFIDQDLGEATLEGSILLNVLAVFTGSCVSNEEM